MKKTCFVFVLIVLLGCVDDDKKITSPVNIRITNVSDFDYVDVLVNPGREEFGYGSIRERFKLQPIDYVGASLLEAGNYSYAISFDPSQGEYGLDLTLVKD
jgi:hypothetical protein